uniref:ATP synthase subunit e, mitochondrial n=1 Tax=Acrobeloides nanus TaxID=290746 RepID=A0A914E7G0_9BILA
MAEALRNFWPKLVATRRLWMNQYEDYGRSNQLRLATLIGLGGLYYLIHRSGVKKEEKKQLKVKEKQDIVREALGRASVNN